MNKNLYLNDSEKEWLLKVKSILSKPQPPIPMPPNNEIWYTSSDGNVVTPMKREFRVGTIIPLPNEEYISIFGANLISNTYKDGKGIIKFNREVTKVGDLFYDSETVVGAGGFFGNDKLTTMILPNSVTSIGYQAFYNCTSLTSIIIPNSVTSIGEAAFNGCSGLASIVVSDGNTKYDSRNNCNAIIETSTNKLITGCKNTIIPDSVTSIGDDAFGCSGITSINIPDSVENIGRQAFYGCHDLTSVIIGNNVTDIGQTAFSGCSSLTSVTIPNSVTSIGEAAFSNCIALISINIPNSVTSIGDGAFYGCSGLTSITSLNTTPPTIGNSSTLPSHKTYTIYVPTESVKKYKGAQYWSNKASQIQAIQ